MLGRVAFFCELPPTHKDMGLGGGKSVTWFYVVHVAHLGTTCLALRRHLSACVLCIRCAWQLCFQAAVGGVCKPESGVQRKSAKGVGKAHEWCACICPFAGGRDPVPD